MKKKNVVHTQKKKNKKNKEIKPQVPRGEQMATVPGATRAARL